MYTLHVEAINVGSTNGLPKLQEQKLIVINPDM